MQITQAVTDHAPGLAAVHVRSWQAAYAHILAPEFLAAMSIAERTQRWRDIVQAAQSQTLVALREGGGVCAFVSYGKCRDEGAGPEQGEIWALYADPDCWDQGFGRTLLRRALDELRALGFQDVSLWVLSQNRRGRHFYEACGFAALAGSEKRFELGGREVEELRYQQAL